MREKKSIMQNVDSFTLGLYFALLFIGLLTVFAVNFDKETSRFFDFSQTHGRQMIWMFISLALGFSILTFDINFFTKFSPVIYIALIVLLIITVAVAREINGARSWLQVGSIRFQPAEFAKTATALMLAKYLSIIDGKPRSLSNKIIAYLVLGVPMGIIILQQDMGSALVYVSLVIVLFREGFPINEVTLVVLLGLCFILSLILPKATLIYVMSAFILVYVVLNSLKIIRKARFTGTLFIVVFNVAILCFVSSVKSSGINISTAIAGLALLITSYFLVWKQKNHKVWTPVMIYFVLTSFAAFATEFIMNDVLEPHQTQRVLTLVGKSSDPDANYNVIQSKMTIGSGGIAGKGYLQGTLTQLKHVPEQSTDFIFCTIGEEFGFLGTTVFLLIYLMFLLRIIFIAERQRSPFSRVYAYSVASIFFLQIMINVGMTIGLVPVIGIPLPFISYGGSSVLAFSIMIFIMLRLDADRLLILR
jgi:rod shape determining protein RodA